MTHAPHYKRVKASVRLTKARRRPVTASYTCHSRVVPIPAQSPHHSRPHTSHRRCPPNNRTRTRPGDGCMLPRPSPLSERRSRPRGIPLVRDHRPSTQRRTQRDSNAVLDAATWTPEHFTDPTVTQLRRRNPDVGVLLLNVSQRSKLHRQTEWQRKRTVSDRVRL